MIKGIIFDLDGVIVSTDKLHFQAWKYMADKENIYFDEEINNSLRGISRKESLEIILKKSNKKYSEEEKLKLMDIKNSYYVNLLDFLSPSDKLKDVDLLLSELKSKNIKIAIGSSSKNTKKILKQIGLIDSFDAIADGNEIKNSKPDPEVLLLASKKLNLKPSECAVIEDAVAGIEAAKRGGMIAFAIKDAKKSNLAEYKLDKLIDVIKYL